MPVTHTDSAHHSSLVPPVDPGALVSKPSPRKEPTAQPAQVKPDGAREPFDFSEYIEFLQYAEWGWF